MIEEIIESCKRILCMPTERSDKEEILNAFEKEQVKTWCKNLKEYLDFIEKECDKEEPNKLVIKDKSRSVILWANAIKEISKGEYDYEYKGKRR